MKPSAKNYLEFIQRKIAEQIKEMDTISLAADAASERVVAGGRLFGMGDEKGFQSEYSGRAGGLMGISTAGEDVGEGDVVIAATTDSGPGTEYRDTLAGFRSSGAFVILIGSRESREKGVEDLFIDNHLPLGLNQIFADESSPICPTAGVCNVAALWTLTAEFVAACTRRGKMPVCYQSGNMDAGRVRNKLLKGAIFHGDGEINIVPIGAGEKGREYLFNIQRCFAGIGALEIEKFEEAGRLASDALSKGNTVWCDVIGHHLHSQKGIAGDPEIFKIGAPESDDEAGPLEPGDMYIFNGYFIYPADELERVREAGISSVWLLGGRETQDVYPQPGEIHIDAQWRYGDASLSMPGSDIRIVPPSGVIMTTTLWMLIAEAAGRVDG
jgi:uncharacterized phosphosugar-binding protein